MFRISIVLVSSFLKSQRRMCSPVLFSMEVRMKLESVIPGISTGFWKEMNIPSLEILSADSSVMSCPSKLILPSLILYLGSPIRVEPSVDLPAPLGPINTCVSPRLIVRFTPCRISLSSSATDTTRFCTFNSCSATVTSSFIYIYM